MGGGGGEDGVWGCEGVCWERVRGVGLCGLWRVARVCVVGGVGGVVADGAGGDGRDGGFGGERSGGGLVLGAGAGTLGD